METGNKVELLFSTLYIDGLCPGLKGTVTGLDGTDITTVLWDNGVEMAFITDSAVDTYRVVSRAFVTKAQKRGRIIMQFLGSKAVPPPAPPEKDDRVEFLFSTVSLVGSGLHRGNRGTVNYVGGSGIIYVAWDNGAIASLIPGWDHFTILSKPAAEDTQKAMR